MSSEEQIQMWREEDGPVLSTEQYNLLAKRATRVSYFEKKLDGKSSWEAARMNKYKTMAGRYGISEERAKKIIDSLCAVCGKEGPSEIDHEHVCPKCGIYTARPMRNGHHRCSKCREFLPVRGPLCRRHNTQMGFLESIMREGNYEKFLEYLKRYV